MKCPKCNTPMIYCSGSGFRCSECGYQEPTEYELRVPTPMPPLKEGYFDDFRVRRYISPMTWKAITMLEAFIAQIRPHTWLTAEEVQAQFKQKGPSVRNFYTQILLMSVEDTQRTKRLEWESAQWRNC